MNKVKKFLFTTSIALLPMISYASGEVPESLGGTFNADMVNLLSTPRAVKVGYYALVALIIFIGAAKSAVKYAAASDDHEKAAAIKEIKRILFLTIGLPTAFSFFLALLQWRLGVSILF